MIQRWFLRRDDKKFTSALLKLVTWSHKNITDIKHELSVLNTRIILTYRRVSCWTPSEKVDRSALKLHILPKHWVN